MVKDGVIPIDVADFEFLPATITLKAGETLHFVNNKGVFAHDVHVTQNGVDIFPRTEGAPGASVDVKIEQLGTYELLCDRHLHNMIGTITVT